MYGQLGGSTNSTTPIQVNGLSEVTAIAGGNVHTVALKSDGTVWALGANWNGQLGDGTYTNSTTPLQVSSLSGVTAIAGGQQHTVALKSDGTVWAWGNNSYGQLGDGTTTSSATPVQVSGLSGVTAIACGYLHTVALKSDGTVWTWGHNYGQLGDGTTTNRSAPVQASGLSGVTAIAAGKYHTVALKSNGTVWTWGNNDWGQLGYGTTANSFTPIDSSYLGGITAIAAGEYHTVALKSDGTVWACGKNDYGQLGDGTTTTRTIPVKANSLNGVAAIACGGHHTVALKSDGTVWDWGSTTSRNTPVQVTNFNVYSPTVSTGSATNVTSSSVTLNGTVNANEQSITAWFNYGITSGSYTGTSTTQSVSGSSDTTVSIDISGLSSSTRYYYRIAAQNSAGTSYGSEASFITSAPPDTTAPSGSITISRPGYSDASYTNSTTITLTLSATDNIGVTGYYISDSSSTPSASASVWTSVTSTTSYSGTVSYSLSSGEGGKTIYVWYKDAAGNVSNSASDTIILDTTAPTVNITSPTTDTTYTTTSSTISLSGSASDSSSGIDSSSLKWSNNRGGNGSVRGGASWTTTSDISLSSGDNTITVTANDEAGNSGTDTITVTYNAGSALMASTGAASNISTNSATLNGTVNANGASTTAWFQYGTTSGSYGNTSSTQSVSGTSDTTVSINISGLSAGTTYYYRIAAQNSAGTKYGSEKSFTTTTVCTDSYESNDSFGAAYGPITSGSSYNGKICSASDVDYFKITVARAGLISFTLSVPSDKDYDLYLYNSSQSELAYSSQGAGATDSIIYFASTTGTYYIKVFGYGGDYDENQTYTLSGTWLSTASPPTVTTGSASNITTNSVTLNGTVNDNGVSTTAWFQYGTTSGSYSSTSSTQSASGPNTTLSISISGLSSGTTYYYRIAAQNSAGTTYGNEMSFTTSDASKPTGSVNINSGASYTNSTTVTLNLSATDNAGVTGYYSSTSSTTPSVSTSGWTSINSTTSYTADVSYTVSSGDGSKAVYVWYKDNSGNVSNTASDEITLDTAVPTIIITTPTSSSTYTTTSSTMSMDGTAFDNASGISSVAWSNSKGGNGTATGTTAWSVSSITLSSGDNTITVTAKDNAGNTGTDAIAVTYSGGAVASPMPTPKPSATPTPKPTPKTSPSPTKTPAITPIVTVHPTPTPSPTPIRGKGAVLGFVYDLDSEPLLGVEVTIAGNNFSDSTETDSNGYYEFDELTAGDYTLTYEKEDYETQTMDISLKEDKVFIVDDVTMEEIEKGKIYGYIVKINGDPLESARLRLKGVTTKVVRNTSSDADGFFEFTGLGADTYVIFAKKTRYKKAKATVKLEEEESKEIEIEMKRTSKRIKGLILMDDGQ